MRSWLAPLLAGAIVASAGVPDPAEAELAIDLYGGPSWTRSADLRTSKGLPHGLLQPYVTAGPAWAFTLKGDEVDLLKFLALFAEYRYSFFPDYQVKNRGVTYEADVDTHNIVFGVSLRF
jgi:hypothetical protein